MAAALVCGTIGNNDSDQAAFDCDLVKTDSFLDEFSFMALGDESCRSQSCTDTVSTWKSDIVFDLIVDPKESRSSNLEREINRTFSILKGATGIGARLGGSDKSLFFIIVDKKVETQLSDGILGFISGSIFREKFLPIISRGKCIGNIVSVPGTDSRDIIGGVVFIPQTVLHSNNEILQKCVLEETFNGFGLFRDPKGQASLFDNQNYVQDGKDITYSNKTLLMIRYLYYLGARSDRAFQNFEQSVCEKDVHER